MNADERRFDRKEMSELTERVMKATELRLCLLLNFAKPKLEVRRIANNF